MSGDPFSNPSGVAFGPDGNLYVLDEGFGCGGGSSGVYKYSVNGTLLGTFLPNILSSPIDLAFGPGGDLFVTDANERVAEFNGTTGAEMADFVPTTVRDPPRGSAISGLSPTVPEPVSLALLGLGLAGLACLPGPRRR